jgi:D-serine deaminase-like pyridoxal phosphate-dependent protein
LAAKRLRGAGIDCPEVSIGSTPTAHFIDDLTGITEVRAGVYVFFDLVMAGLNVCDEEDIALSVLTSVIGHQVDKGWVITDGGWMAMSRDRGTQDQPVDQGYGLIANKESDAVRYIVTDANQEHGIITPRNHQDSTDFSAFPLASTVNVLPNHACATAAQFDQYYVVDGDQVVDIWQSVKGW